MTRRRSRQRRYRKVGIDVDLDEWFERMREGRRVSGGLSDTLNRLLHEERMRMG